MSKKYKFTRPWKRWNVGDVVDAYEYKRLPIEIKNSCISEVVEPVIPEPIPEKPVEIKRVVSNYFKPKDSEILENL